jgi:hypothetical protein
VDEDEDEAERKRKIAEASDNEKQLATKLGLRYIKKRIE